ncbi:MAG: GAF domain-containing protein [Hymenobacter sp.]|nr:MAG: GAF domain-containing protein [Hymenobacter sp.]
MVAFSESIFPVDEHERLESLYHYDVLHSLQEELFDELVTLTAALFRLPIAYISLVAAQQIHYKASFGLPPLPPQPRADLLCAQVVKQGEVVVYHDLASAPQTALTAQSIQNGLAQQARFYVGAPLRMPDQHVIGTLCLVDQQPREFSADEQNMLEAIANLASQAVVVRCLCRSTPTLGNTRWQTMQLHARDEVYALGALVRYLAARYGTSVPVPQEILQPVWRRLQDLHVILQEY